MRIKFLAQGNNILLPGFEPTNRPTDWSNVFVDCINVVFCRLLGLVAGFNAICNACLTGVPSGSLKMCPVNLCFFSFILSVHKCCLVIAYISLFVIMFW